MEPVLKPPTQADPSLKYHHASEQKMCDGVCQAGGGATSLHSIPRWSKSSNQQLRLATLDNFHMSGERTVCIPSGVIDDNGAWTLCGEPVVFSTVPP
jgi:hypothetical protein